MRSLTIAVLLGLSTVGLSTVGLGTVPAAAQPHPATARPAAHPAPAPAAKPGGPKSIGTFEDWTAATNMEAGQTVCYAFTRAVSSNPAIPGRGQVVLTVTERSGGRDAVALSAGFTYSASAAVAVAIDQTTMEFYTAQRSAFARDGHAAVVDFQRSARVTAKSPTAKGTVTDQFSLKGFSAAYAAVTKACPPK